MATAPSPTYRVASGASINAGRWPGGRFAGGIGMGDAALSGSIFGSAPPPTWVPTTAWQWTDIPGTIWSNYIKDDGTGIAPAVTAADPGPSRTYRATWDYSGPCYSPLNHEIYMFGGGHAATTNNIVTRWNLGKNSPDISVVSAPTSEADRAARFASFSSTESDNRLAFADGKPYSPHAYWNSCYSDAIDEYVVHGLGFMASPGILNDGLGSGWYGSAVRGLQRNGTWRADTYYESIPVGQMSARATDSPKLLSADGLAIYYWVDNSSSVQGLKKFNLSSKLHSSINSTGALPTNVCCLNGDGTLAMFPGDSAGWTCQTINLSTGARQSVTVSGYSIPGGLRCYGAVWVPSISKYVMSWITTAAFNGGSADTTVSSIVLTSLEFTSVSTATSTQISMTGTAPTKCSSLRGMFYDPIYDCLLFVMSFSTPIKSIKVSN